MDDDSMPLPNHVTCRNGVYQYVRRVPDDVADVFAAARIQRSLRTRSPSEARLRAAELDRDIEEQFVDARRRKGVVLEALPTAGWKWTEWRLVVDWLKASWLWEDQGERTKKATGASFSTDRQRKPLWLAELKDRAKLGKDLETVLQRLRDVSEQKSLTVCQTQVATRSISTQITALRRQLVTEELERRIAGEIAALDLTHLPFKFSDSSSGGKSLFSVGLHGAGTVKNNQVLSEGEQRALALACFLAEIGGDDSRYGITSTIPYPRSTICASAKSRTVSSPRRRRGGKSSSSRTTWCSLTKWFRRPPEQETLRRWSSRSSPSPSPMASA
ncbi:DUF6538 domain-containing protein [Jiella sp. M17.18]|uniref:DUF6538 domain-containing protein n=1 Tax=Jiella sp. M17.18 TaxID=3234247 RepID=UPI0034DF7698